MYLKTNSFNTDQKKKELSAILRINEKPELKQVHQYPPKNGWNRFALETTDKKLIPLLLYPPVDNSHGFVILCDPEGKHSISSSIINEYREEGTGIIIVDLTGTGEMLSPLDTSADSRFVLHTLSRAELWLGKTVLGEWAKDLNSVTEFLNTSFKPIKICIDGTREAGLAGLFLNSLEGNIDNIILRDAPVSYLFDSRVSIDFYNMCIHLPGFLNWGDVSLAAALSGKNVTFINPKTMSGQLIVGNQKKECVAEYDMIRINCNQAGKTSHKAITCAFFELV